MKICTKCGIEKELDCYYKYNSKKNGYRSICKSCISIQSKKRWQEKSEELKIKYKDSKKQANKKYRETHKEELKISRKISGKKWRDKNKDYQRKYNEENKNNISYISKEYRETHKEELKIKRRIRHKYRLKNDMLYRLKNNIGSSIRQSIKKLGHKKSRTYEILGCSFEEFKLYIELKFEPWMTWENYGKYNGELNYGWDLDHIIPISSAKTEEEVIKLNHYTNFQPLCSKVNRDVKINKIL